MDTFDNKLIKTLTEIIEANPEIGDKLDFEDIISNVTATAIKLTKDSLIESSQEMLDERRKLTNEFEQRNIKRWKKAFDTLETHIVICTEIGEEFNNSYHYCPVNFQSRDI